MIADQSESGIAVREDDHALDGLPREFVTFSIIAKCVTTFFGFMVWLPLSIDHDFCLIVEAPVDPVQ